MAIANTYGRSNEYARTDGVTMQERIAEQVDALVYALGEIEDEAERWQETYGYVPIDVQERMHDAYTSLETYANYWSFDC
jgi:hypothetical protein